MTMPFSASRAYLIGIAGYSHAPWRLKTPVSDTQALATLLREQQGFEVTSLLDPTADQLLAMFEHIQRENPGDDERILIYYAGHGLQRDSAYGLKGYFVPADARPGDESSMVPMELLADILRQIGTRHVLLILDCCFAGTFRMLTRRDTLGGDGQDQPLFRQHYEIFTRFPSKLVLCSTSYRQKAFDRIEDSDDNSPFNRFLRRAIAGEADYTGDRLVTASELKTYLTDNVSNITGYAGNLQSVGLDALDGDGEGEFLFFLDGFNVNQLPEQAYINPYKGLKAYEPADAALFFGRYKATQALLAKAKEHPFVIVAGASGTGKSSLVKAGLLPALQRDGPDEKRIAIIRPGKNPLAALPPDASWDLLVIDQWEEVITQATDLAGVEKFYAEVRRLLDGGKRIVGTVRSDFEAQTRHDILEPQWTQGRFVVPSFTSEEYHDVIVQPAKRVACLFEDRDLVSAIEQEVAQQPGPLPLLSFMLSELFERAKRETTRYRTIRRSHYEAIGGVSGALRNKAEEVFAGLSNAAHRDTMRRLMLRMVALSAGEMAGRRVYLTELDYHDDSEDRRIETVIKKLDEAKLIRRDADDAGRRFIEPAHDALVRAWRRLWDWVRELGEENLLLHAKLNAAAADYESAGRDKAFLWTNDPRLDQAQGLMWRDKQLFNAAERAFTESSLQEKKRRTTRNRIITASVVAGLSVLAVAAYWQSRVATRKAEEATESLRQKNEEEMAKERLNVNKLVTDGTIYKASGDFDLAIKKYYRADTTSQNYPGDTALSRQRPLLSHQIAGCCDSILIYEDSAQWEEVRIICEQYKKK